MYSNCVKLNIVGKEGINMKLHQYSLKKKNLKKMQCPLSVDNNGTLQESSSGRYRSGCRGKTWGVLDLGSRVVSVHLSDKRSLSGFRTVGKAWALDLA